MLGFLHKPCRESYNVVYSWYDEKYDQCVALRDQIVELEKANAKLMLEKLTLETRLDQEVTFRLKLHEEALNYTKAQEALMKRVAQETQWKDEIAVKLLKAEAKLGQGSPK